MLDVKKLLAHLVNRKVTQDILYNASANATVTLSKNLSDYDYIVVCPKIGSTDYRQASIIPTIALGSGFAFHGTVLHGTTAATASSYRVCTYDITYNSDTRLTLATGGSNAITDMLLIGLKLGG